MKLKKYFMVLLIALLCVMGMPKNILAAGGICGAGSTWDYSDGVLTVSGTGEVTEIPWMKLYEKSITKVVIGEGITSIRFNAFRDCIALKEVTFPESLTYIGGNAFEGCTGLTEVTLPKNLQLCGVHCFASSGVRTVTFEAGSTIVSRAMFNECRNLTTIRFAQSIKQIEEHAFEGCTALTKVTLPYYLENLDWWAFADCPNLKEVTIYQKVNEFSVNVFGGTTGKLKIYGKKNSVAHKFAQKEGHSFAVCKIPALKGITYTKGNLKYQVITDYIDGKGTVMVTGMKKNASAITIPKTVKLESYNYKVVKINSKAFYKKDKIKKVTIQSTYIASIGKNAFKGINRNAVFKVPKSKYSSYKKLLTSKTGFVKKTMKVKK